MDEEVVGSAQKLKRLCHKIDGWGDAVGDAKSEREENDDGDGSSTVALEDLPELTEPERIKAVRSYWREVGMCHSRCFQVFMARLSSLCVGDSISGCCFCQYLFFVFFFSTFIVVH